MKKSHTIHLPLIAAFLMLLCLAACEKEEPIVPDPSSPSSNSMLKPFDQMMPFENYVVPPEPEPFVYTPEVQEPVMNDFTLIKACIGLSGAESANLLIDHGFTEEGDKFVKTEGDITKVVHVHSPQNVEMNIHSSEFTTLKQWFTQWMTEIRNSAFYPKLARANYELSPGWGTGYQYYSTPEALIAALSTTSSANGMNAVFSGNDIYANVVNLTLMRDLSAVYMQIVNPRAGEPADDFTSNDLQEDDLQHHILISKVDYLTFRYKGFYALDVTDKLDDGTRIPLLADYHAPNDFGSIKLYYRNTSNLLISGDLAWCEGGELRFPESFRAGEQVSYGLPYPGQFHFAFINNQGNYVSVTDESELQRVWQSVSRQREFQHYYEHTSKIVAVYLFPPSDAWGDYSDAFYLVITEQ